MNETNYINGFRICDFRRFKQSSGFLKGPIFGNSVLFSIKVVDNFFNGSVLVDQIFGSLGANSSDCVTVIATQKNTEIYKLKY